jgi:acetoin utilization deacetylase AcuC-like enzyme
VAIVDVDVHHGNGTQDIFYDDPAVLYISTHQSPFYPGTGAATEIGSGAGAGFTVNVPLEAGATDADYALVHDTIVLPVLEQFAPELTIVSAGFDAHERDPLASMRMTAEGYAKVLGGLAALASRSSTALVAVTEGGYELTALAACLQASISAIDDARGPSSHRVTAQAASAEMRIAARAIEVVRAAQKSFWRKL